MLRWIVCCYWCNLLIYCFYIAAYYKLFELICEWCMCWGIICSSICLITCIIKMTPLQTLFWCLETAESAFKFWSQRWTLFKLCTLKTVNTVISSWPWVTQSWRFCDASTLCVIYIDEGCTWWYMQSVGRCGKLISRNLPVTQIAENVPQWDGTWQEVVLQPCAFLEGTPVS